MDHFQHFAAEAGGGGQLAKALVDPNKRFVADQAVDSRGTETFPAVSVYLYVEDVDSLARQALAAGAKEIMAVADQYYGDRSGASRIRMGSRPTRKTSRTRSWPGAPRRLVL